MWATGATHMIARATGSTLFANYNLASILTNDHRPMTTTTPTTSDNVNIISKMRDLRARSPYALFLKDNYKEISAKHPDLKLVDISKKIAEVWKSLPSEKKESYSKKSQDQRATYEEAKKKLSSNDLQTIDADEKAKRIEHRIKKSIQQFPTKKPRTAYAHYLSSLDRGEADLRDFMKGAAQRWTQMTTQDKQKFEELHQEEQQKYAKELVAWASENAKQTKAASRRSASSSSAKAKRATSKKAKAEQPASRSKKTSSKAEKDP